MIPCEYGEPVLRAALELAEHALSVQHCADLGSLLGDVARIVGSDTASLARIDLAGQDEAAILWPPARVPNLATLAAYPSTAHSHPARGVLLRTVRENRPWSLPIQLAELVPTRTWHETPLCREVLDSLTDQLCLPLSYRSTTVTAISLSRLGGHFTGPSRQLLTLAAPHLRAAVARTTGSSTLTLRLAPTVEWVTTGFATCPARSTPQRAGSDADALTPVVSPREQQVLDLVIEGLTDAAIARRLGIAPATVSKHLHRLYSRLGLGNRAAATRWWLRHDLPVTDGRPLTGGS